MSERDATVERTLMSYLEAWFYFYDGIFSFLRGDYIQICILIYRFITFLILNTGIFLQVQNMYILNFDGCTTVQKNLAAAKIRRERGFRSDVQRLKKNCTS